MPLVAGCGFAGCWRSILSVCLCAISPPLFPFALCRLHGTYRILAGMPRARMSLVAALVGVFLTSASLLLCSSFQAPEIFKGKPYDEKADVWSLAIVIYICLCGLPPYVTIDDANGHVEPFWVRLSGGLQRSRRRSALRALCAVRVELCFRC